MSAERAPYTGVIPAKAGTNMWTAPCLQDLDSGVRRIACDHISGLLSRPHMTAAKMVQLSHPCRKVTWVPAFAGMTMW